MEGKVAEMSPRRGRLWENPDVLLSVMLYLDARDAQLNFRLLSKSANSAFRKYRLKGEYTLLCPWRKLRKPTRALLSLSHLYPKATRLVITHPPQKFLYEDILAIGTLFPDILEIDFNIPALAEEADNYAAISPPRGGNRIDRQWGPPTALTGDASMHISSLVGRCQNLKLLRMRTVTGDISSAMLVFGETCPAIEVLDIGSSSLHCATTWEAFATCLANCVKLREVHFSGHCYDNNVEGLPSSLRRQLLDANQVRKFQVGGRFTGKMIKDVSSMISRASRLHFGRTTDITVRTLSDIFEENALPVAVTSLSMTAKGSPAILTSSLIRLMKKCTMVEEIQLHKFHEVNHHLMNVLLNISERVKIRTVEIKDYLNYSSGQPTEYSKLRLVGNLPYLQKLTFSDLNDRIISRIAESCPVLEMLVAQHSPRITDDSIAHIGQMKKLKSLQLDSTKMTRKGQLELLEKIGDQLHSLKFWNDDESNAIDDDTLVSIVHLAPKLNELRLIGTKITERSCEMLGKVGPNHLEVLHLGELSFHILQSLREVWPTVSIDGCPVE
jgi:hypothetical protein